MTVEIICADARDALAAMPDGSVHACITSPPYWGLRDYGLEPVVWGGDEGCEHEWAAPLPPKPGRGNASGDFSTSALTNPDRQDELPRAQDSGAFCRRCNAWRGSLGLEPTPELYVEHIVQVMREVRRVLRDDGVLWLNLGDSYASGKGTCYNPGGGDGSLGKLRKEAGAHPLDRGNKSTLTASGLKPKDLVGIPWRVAFALQADGWWLRSDIVWSKPNPMPESVTDRPTRSHEYLFLLSKSARYFYAAAAIREPLAPASIERISQPTFDQQNGGPKDYAKTGVNRHRSARKALEGLAASHKGSHFDKGKTAEHQLGRASSAPRQDNPAARNRRSVWEIATQPYPKAHFATFPEKLVEPCILAGTSERGCCPECGAPWERVVEKGELREHPDREGRSVRNVAFDGDGYSETGGTLGLTRDSQTVGWRPTCKHGAEPAPCRVLDPFAGSGTVGLVAERLGRHSVLIDASEEYCEMARHRTAQRGLMMEATR